MKIFFRFLQSLALGSWIGAILYFAAVVTLGAFAVLPSRDLAGAMVGYTIRGLHDFGIVAAVIYLGSSIGARRSLKGLAGPGSISVWAMLILTLVSRQIVIPKMDALRAQMGSIERTAAANPLLARFERLHGISVELEVAVLVVGLLALYLTVREHSAAKVSPAELPAEHARLS